MKATRTYLVEDRPVMREGYESLIALEPDLDLCGSAGSAEDALSEIQSLVPDVAVVDLQLPGVNGVELIKRIRAIGLPTKLLVVSAHEEDLYAERALKAGAQGYLMKQESAKRVVTAIRAVADGRLYLSASLRSRLLEGWLDSRNPASRVEALSDREIEVFELMGLGRTTKQIAVTLGLSPKTIETHRSHIKEKLGATSTPELIREAVLWTSSAMP